MRAVLILMMVLLAGCAGFQHINAASASFTYATIKQIESEQWTQQGVLDEVARIRAISESSAQIDINDIVNSVLERSGITDASDRFLAAQFLGGMQSYIVNVQAPEEVKVRLGRVLDAVERGALLAGG